MNDFVLNDYEKRMNGAVDNLKINFAGLRSGRASSSLVDNLLVACSILVSPINDDKPLPNPFLILFTRQHSLFGFLGL